MQNRMPRSQPAWIVLAPKGLPLWVCKPMTVLAGVAQGVGRPQALVRMACRDVWVSWPPLQQLTYLHPAGSWSSCIDILMRG